MSYSPLYKRPLDVFYFLWFLVNLPISLCLDMQHIYPEYLVPEQLKSIYTHWLELSSDPITLGGLGLIGHPGQYTWCSIALWFETFLQIPTFFIGLWGLWNASRRANILILIYGASTATIVLECIATILSVPATSELTISGGIPSVTEAQRIVLLKAYTPYLVVPTLMTLDMGWRLWKLVDESANLAKNSHAKSL
ncbi:hypothetical protein CALCODRAFT_515788 [Calocera cornea HHB12733]|uniref:EXPERA domain-containing protein n=1 Tax=Calocera cornea HHB12733 TaxID=1353952 RepID=A0A165HXJ7_9BASI|nr:hypothetical protein CALCODRAFT_515788 [Calocera cornea HHB12733]